jgi:hypothetical protein
MIPRWRKYLDKKEFNKEKMLIYNGNRNYIKKSWDNKIKKGNKNWKSKKNKIKLQFEKIKLNIIMYIDIIFKNSLEIS